MLLIYKDFGLDLTAMGNTADDDGGIFLKVNLHTISKHITFGVYFEPIEKYENGNYQRQRNGTNKKKHK